MSGGVIALNKCPHSQGIQLVLREELCSFVFNKENVYILLNVRGAEEIQPLFTVF